MNKTFPEESRKNKNPQEKVIFSQFKSYIFQGLPYVKIVPNSGIALQCHFE